MIEIDASLQQSAPAFFLARHGETVWNTSGRYQGAMDSPLTEKGREQARRIGRKLASVCETTRPLLAYVSPLGRARETAALIGQSVLLDIRLEPRLAEISAGAWDGLSMYEIDVEYPGALSKGGPHDWYFLGPGAETFEDALARVSEWLKDAVSPSLVVTHGLVSRIIRGVSCGMSKEDMLQLAVPQDGFYRLEDRLWRLVQTG